MNELVASKLKKITGFNLIFCIGVILWGAFVRATGSGAGCGAHWPLCNGKVIPRTHSAELIIELTHRLTSGLFLIGIIAALIYTFRKVEKGHAIRKAAVVSLVFVLIEAAVGAGLVLLELVADNVSSYRVYWVGSHLVNTFILVGVLTVNYWLIKAKEIPKNLFSLKGSRLWVVCLILFLLVASSGAIVALGDTLFPVNSLAEGIKQDLDPTSHFLIRLRVIHPILAIISAALICWFALIVKKSMPDTKASKYSHAIFAGVLTQVGVGVVNMLLLAPVWIQMVHLLLANIVWIYLVLCGLEKSKQQAS